MKTKVQVIVLAVAFLALSAFAWLKPADEISDSELRKLAQFPEVSGEKILNGTFMKEFESYTLDQFPMRDQFRTVKAVVSLYGFQQMDNNSIYVEKGYAAKMEYPLSENSVTYAAGRFKNVYSKFIEGSEASCYFSVIPDKNYFLADDHGALSMDYDALYGTVKNAVDFADYIDITDLLTKEDYYRTDTHWNQVEIADVAKRLADKMGTSVLDEYELHTVETPFYGVYYGQAALPMKPDQMQYLTNAVIDSAKVFDWQNNKEISVYNEDAMGTRAPYDLFLGGSLSMITIENPLAPGTDVEGRELVVFRDSFGSSLLPLMISGYEKITIFDIRYLPGDRLGSFITFDKQDVLFIYSAPVLNNSSVIK